ncbi:MAG: DUF2924 domain-containing protein [Myxococcaceae bacterium]
MKHTLEVALPNAPENASMSDSGIQPQGGNNMGKAETLRAERKAAASTTEQLAALTKMQVPELAEKYFEVFGEPPRTRHKEYLRKRIAWRIQELAEGGLSLRALERIEQLAPLAPVRWRQPVSRNGAATPVVANSRDGRLPPVGTVITRMHKEKEHHVTVLSDGFQYEGQRYRSLSKVARLITGTQWNGFLFFFGRQERAQ